MGIKTIAVDTRIYERLAEAKREGESFSEVIDRLLTEVGEAHTGKEILSGVETLAPLSTEDAEVFLGVVAGNRAGEDWEQRDLR
jgi:predicted CopG family antitoxin